LCIAFFLLCAAGACAAADDAPAERAKPSRADSAGVADASEGPHPLGLELQVLARDVTSPEYLQVLGTMIPTDLEAEWERVGTPDNYLLFMERHGGEKKVLADPSLKQAYDRRRKIADDFLALIRDAYRKKGRKPPFEDPAKIEPVLRRAGALAAGGEGVAAAPVRVVMPVPGSERQWPRFRGPTGQGTVLDGTFPLHWGPEQNIVWKTEIPGRGHGSPVVWDNRIFIATASADGNERSLLCFDRTTGKLLWRETAPAPSDQEKLYSKNSYASSTPVVDGERVIAFFGNSGLFCCDVNGRRLWHRDLGRFITMHGPGTSPLLYKDKVIVIQYQNSGPTLFAAFDKQTGEPLWRHERENAMCWSTPVVLRIGDRDDLVYNSSHRVVGYDPDTGEERWRMSGSTREAIPTIVAGGNLIFSTSGRNGPTLAFRAGGEGDLTETNLLWQSVRGGPHVPSPVYYNGRLFMVNDTGIVTCLNAQTGDAVWQKRLTGRCSMSPLEAGGLLLITNEEGKSFVLKAADAFEIVAENDLGEPTLATPAVLGGRIYFRTAKHLICIGDAASAEASGSAAPGR